MFLNATRKIYGKLQVASASLTFSQCPWAKTTRSGQGRSAAGGVHVFNLRPTDLPIRGRHKRGQRNTCKKRCFWTPTVGVQTLARRLHRRLNYRLHSVWLRVGFKPGGFWTVFRRPSATDFIARCWITVVFTVRRALGRGKHRTSWHFEAGAHLGRQNTRGKPGVQHRPQDAPTGVCWPKVGHRPTGQHTGQDGPAPG